MNYGNLGYNNSIFTGDIDKDGTIYSVGAGRERLKVGIDIQREQELLQAVNDMQETLENWKPKMIEHGYIQIPLTPEQIAQETANEQLRLMQQQSQGQAQLIATQNEAMGKMMSLLQAMEEKIGGVSNGRDNGYSTGTGNDEIGSDSQENRKVTGGTKVSPTARKTTVSAKSK